MSQTIAILGTGRMGEALLSGLLRSGWAAERVTCTDALEARLEQISQRHRVRTTTDNAAAVRESDVVVIAVKPQTIGALLDEIGGELDPQTTVVSVAAGISTATIEAAAAADVPVVRVMSNVAVQVDEAMSVVSPGTHAHASHLEVAERLFGQVGTVLRLPESDLDSVTAVSGSGPAYIALVVEAMIEGGVLLGLPRDVATTLAVRTLVGVAELLRRGDLAPSDLREMVTSPGGTTAAALGALERGGVRPAFLDALAAAKRRGEELARGAR